MIILPPEINLPYPIMTIRLTEKNITKTLLRSRLLIISNIVIC